MHLLVPTMAAGFQTVHKEKMQFRYVTVNQKKAVTETFWKTKECKIHQDPILGIETRSNSLNNKIRIPKVNRQN